METISYFFKSFIKRENKKNTFIQKELIGITQYLKLIVKS